MQAPTTHNITQALSIYEIPSNAFALWIEGIYFYMSIYATRKTKKENNLMATLPRLSEMATSRDIRNSCFPYTTTTTTLSCSLFPRLRFLSKALCSIESQFSSSHLKFSLSQFDSREIRNKIEFGAFFFFTSPKHYFAFTRSFFFRCCCCCWPSAGKTKWFPNWFPFLKRHQNDWWREIKYYHRLRNPSRVFFSSFTHTAALTCDPHFSYVCCAIYW